MFRYMEEAYMRVKDAMVALSQAEASIPVKSRK